jgi:UDP-N-acetyl-D-glucosamine dehydrogenase
VDVHGTIMKSQKNLTPATLKKYDIVVITTDHTCFDYDMIVKNAKVVIDTRNATKKIRGSKKNVVLLGSGS